MEFKKLNMMMMILMMYFLKMLYSFSVNLSLVAKVVS